MAKSLQSLLLTALLFISTVSAQTDSGLTGTWSTKSRKVFTGPGFYDPVNEKMIEPSLTGISYSFTDDGHYEEAYYRAISNPTTPSCPEGIMQWQHGTYTKQPNGSLVLNPFGVDGRQLLSSPCTFKTSTYTRYAQQEVFARYELETDPFHNIKRLNLYKFDGSPMAPMYLAYSPPQMLPTQTLNPTATSSGGAAATGNSKAKRDYFEDHIDPLNKNAIVIPKAPMDPDTWLWVGMGLTAVGSVAYWYTS